MKRIRRSAGSREHRWPPLLHFHTLACPWAEAPDTSIRSYTEMPAAFGFHLAADVREPILRPNI